MMSPGSSARSVSVNMMLSLSKRLLVVLGIYCYFWVSWCEAWSFSLSNRWRIRSQTLLLQSSSYQSDADADATEQQPFAFQIQTCQYADLNPVSDIIMDSFYETKTSWRRLLKLAELNRLQQNFPYVDTDLHQMFVAVAAQVTEKDDKTTSSPSTSTTTILHPRTVIGFVDIDARPCRPEIQLPRPYLSDLAVHPNYRRKGVAKALIQACEDFIRTIPRKELYIRVEETNAAAVDMYMNKLNYQSQGVEETKDKKRVMTLHKVLLPTGDDPSGLLAGTSTSPTATDSSSDQEASGTSTGTTVSDDQEFVI